jgi:ParB family chromosome partitioning protein
VHNHPEKPGRFIINHGARRFRASKLAGKKTILAHIDNDYTRTDQLTENLLREGNTALEIATAIGEFLKRGMKKKDIAENIGKTAGYVTQYASLLKLPKSIDQAFRQGRITDVTLIYELYQLHRDHPDEIDTWVNDAYQEFTRGSMKFLRDFLSQKEDDCALDAEALGGDLDLDKDSETAQGQEAGYIPPQQTASSQLSNTNAEPGGRNKAKHPPDTSKLIQVKVKVLHQNQVAQLMLDRRPSVTGYAWLTYEENGIEFEAALRDVQLIAIEWGEW